LRQSRSSAGRSAADYAKRKSEIPDRADNTGAVLDLLAARAPERDLNTADMVQTLQTTMQDDVGALRNETKLKRALSQIDRMARDLGDLPPGDGNGFDMRRIDWLDLRNMLLVARAVTEAAIARTETRGAQQREDYPHTSPEWAINQFVELRDGRVVLSGTPKPAHAVATS
jgi:succinate dehydrogenase / fumarate reductase, flavoprotein subunit